MFYGPSGKSYKLVYIDTNVINDISKNTKAAGKNFLTKYGVDGEYAFVTSFFNLYELSRAKGESREDIIKIFDIIPLLICYTYPQLIKFEKKSSGFSKEMISFAMGPKFILNIQLSTFLRSIETKPDMQKSVKQMDINIEREIKLWKNAEYDPKWMRNFDKNLLRSMNESLRLAENCLTITELGKYKSLEMFAFIKNMFITNKPKDIEKGSVIDAINVSFLPYVKAYVTEGTVGAWIEKEAKKRFSYLSDIDIIKLSDLFD